MGNNKSTINTLFNFFNHFFFVFVCVLHVIRGATVAER